jgi:hypothetical protein
MPTWFADATRRDIVIRSTKVALVVGSILGVINHGDAMLAGTLDVTRWLKIALTYVVPYAVSTYAAVSALRASQRQG